MKRKSSNKKITTKKPSNLLYVDKTLLIATIGLLIFGLIMIMSASSVAAVREYGKSEYFFVTKQAIFTVVGIIATFVILHIDSKWYNLIAFTVMCVVSILLGITLFQGQTTNGATSWLYLGPLSIQPSEFAKTAIILQLACQLGGRKKWDHPIELIFKFLWPLILFTVIAIQPDLGTSIIIVMICYFIFFSLPVDNNKLFKRIQLCVFFGSIAAICLVMGMIKSNNVLIQKIFTPEQIERLSEISAPCNRYEDSGYQVCHGFIAIKTGGIFGAGLGKSTQKFLYLPEAYTDFIYPIIVEELGIVGGGLVLVVYIILLTRILIIARNASTLRGSIIAFGTFAYIMAHIIVNLGGILSLMPLTGVPLPFLSYGGSFLINLMILLAFTQKVAIDTKIKQITKRKVVD